MTSFRFVHFISAAILVFAAPLLTSASPTCSPAPGIHSRSLVHDGLPREYLLQVPQGCEPGVELPLVFGFHGSNMSASAFSLMSNHIPQADREGFVAVYPTGVGLQWNAFGGQANTSDADDLGFVRAMVASISQDLDIDPKRIYVTGHSMGGAFAHRLACEAADLIAAVAPVSFSLYDHLAGCSPARPIPVIQVHGLYDPNVRYAGVPASSVGEIYSAPESAARWAEVDACTQPPRRVTLAGESYCDSYRGCAEGVQVSLCSIRGHHFLYQENEDDIPIHEVVWTSMASHRLVPEPQPGTLQATMLATLWALRAGARVLSSIRKIQS
ncbi:MAG: alpha/beta fold hydrolase [Deltaproteobacteria bacterium]|nr:alpha/beta fold hydrolase [Deltaproteobacteria bacterium]